MSVRWVNWPVDLGGNKNIQISTFDLYVSVLNYRLIPRYNDLSIRRPLNSISFFKKNLLNCFLENPIFGELLLVFYHLKPYPHESPTYCLFNALLV